LLSLHSLRQVLLVPLLSKAIPRHTAHKMLFSMRTAHLTLIISFNALVEGLAVSVRQAAPTPSWTRAGWYERIHEDEMMELSTDRALDTATPIRSASEL